jgi:hypothetical protein
VNEQESIDYLNREGDLRVPCSRYGTSTSDCAPVAYALADIVAEATGEEITTSDLDYAMGLVVNDSDEVRTLIADHGSPEQVDMIADSYEFDATTAGREAGETAGSWVIDGNTSTETARAILRGYEDGDPAVMDMATRPLNGEFAGESIPELSAEFGLPLSNETVADYFESAYIDAFWSTVIDAAGELVD